jgi:nucleoside phosphorylase
MSSRERADRVDVLIMAAHALELESLRAALGADDRATLQGLEVALCEVGVGALVAGAGAMRGLLETKPRAALLVGSCGVYPGRAALQPGQLLIASRLTAVDSAVLSSRAAFPAPMATNLEPDPALTQALYAAASASSSAAVPLQATLATTLAITTDDVLAAQLSDGADCVGENLEAIAVALACRAQQVAFAAVVGITNEVGSHGRNQWLQHHALAARTTSDCVMHWLRGGAR